MYVELLVDEDLYSYASRRVVQKAFRERGRAIRRSDWASLYLKIIYIVVM